MLWRAWYCSSVQVREILVLQTKNLPEILQFTFDQNQHSSLAGTLSNTILNFQYSLAMRVFHWTNVCVYSCRVCSEKCVRTSVLFSCAFSRNKIVSSCTRMHSIAKPIPWIWETRIFANLVNSIWSQMEVQIFPNRGIEQWIFVRHSQVPPPESLTPRNHLINAV